MREEIAEGQKQAIFGVPVFEVSTRANRGIEILCGKEPVAEAQLEPVHRPRITLAAVQFSQYLEVICSSEIEPGSKVNFFSQRTAPRPEIQQICMSGNRAYPL